MCEQFLSEGDVAMTQAVGYRNSSKPPLLSPHSFAHTCVPGLALQVPVKSIKLLNTVKGGELNNMVP